MSSIKGFDNSKDGTKYSPDLEDKEMYDLENGSSTKSVKLYYSKQTLTFIKMLRK